VSGIEVRDEGDLRKYRTEIPNIVLEKGLSPHALALYVHLKRTAGGGGLCYKSTRRLAEETGISTGKISEARTELEKHELIAVNRPKDKRKAAEVTIVDVWPENFAHFAKRSKGEREAVRVHIMNTTRSPSEPRKEPLKESTPTEEGKPSTLKVKDLQATMLKDLHERLKERELLEKRPLTDAYKKRLAGEIRTWLKKRSVAEVWRALDWIVTRWPDIALDLTQAFNNLDGNCRRQEAEPFRRKKIQL
jgi:hypothetical protein